MAICLQQHAGPRVSLILSACIYFLLPIAMRACCSSRVKAVRGTSSETDSTVTVERLEAWFPASHLLPGVWRAKLRAGDKHTILVKPRLQQWIEMKRQHQCGGDTTCRCTHLSEDRWPAGGSSVPVSGSTWWQPEGHKHLIRDSVLLIRQTAAVSSPWTQKCFIIMFMWSILHSKC